MGIEYARKNNHWNYFLTLEQDFEVLSRYIEPCEENNSVYSIELSRLIMASTQEVDVIFKNLCGFLETDSNARSIGAYYYIIERTLNSLFTEEVSVQRFSMTSKPFSSWDAETPPLWWTANNKIKHHRATDFNRATLKNAFNSLAGLFIITTYLVKIEFEKTNSIEADWYEIIDTLLLPEAKLFKFKDDRHHIPQHIVDMAFAPS